MKESSAVMTVFNVLIVLTVFTIIFFALVRTETFLLSKSPCEVEISKVSEGLKSLNSKSTDADGVLLLTQFAKTAQICESENK
jgi:hypothetical protein